MDLVREQVRQSLAPPSTEYDVVAPGLLAWLPGHPETTRTFPLREPSRPEPSLAPSLDTSRLRFGRTPIPWDAWVESWQREESGQPPPEPPTGPVLPPEEESEVTRTR